MKKLLVILILFLISCLANGHGKTNQKLQVLKRMLDNELITEDEYELKKIKIIKQNKEPRK